MRDDVAVAGEQIGGRIESPAERYQLYGGVGCVDVARRLHVVDGCIAEVRADPRFACNIPTSPTLTERALLIGDERSVGEGQGASRSRPRGVSENATCLNKT